MTSSNNDFFASLLEDPASLALATAAYGKPAPKALVTRTVTASVNASALATPRAPKTGTRVVSTKIVDKAPEAAKPADPAAPSFKLPKAGSIDAATFLASLRTAGKRPAVYEQEFTCPISGEVFAAGSPRLNDKGAVIVVHDSKLQIADERAAIAAFCGWTFGDAHGSQLDSATRSAHAVIRRYSALVDGGHVSQPAYRSPEAHAAKWRAPGSVAGLPSIARKLMQDLAGRERLATEDLLTFGKLRGYATKAALPIPAQPKFEGELTEAQLDDMLADHADECEVWEKTVKGARADFDALLMKEFGAGVRGVEPVLDETGETTDYKVIEKANPIFASLLPFCKVETIKVGKREHTVRHWSMSSDMLVSLARLEALAAARLDDVQRNLAAIDADSPTEEQIHRAHAAMEGMLRAGRTVTIEEAVLNVYDPASRSRADLRVGTLVSVASVERLSASDDHGILNTALKA